MSHRRRDCSRLAQSDHEIQKCRSNPAPGTPRRRCRIAGGATRQSQDLRSMQGSRRPAATNSESASRSTIRFPRAEPASSPRPPSVAVQERELQPAARYFPQAPVAGTRARLLLACSASFPRERASEPESAWASAPFAAAALAPAWLAHPACAAVRSIRCSSDRAGDARPRAAIPDP